MKTEHIEIESKQKSGSYATLDEALQAKMEHTRQIMGKLNPEARNRLINEKEQSRENLSSTC